jgi:hypothetical protein
MDMATRSSEEREPTTKMSVIMVQSMGSFESSARFDTDDSEMEPSSSASSAEEMLKLHTEQDFLGEKRRESRSRFYRAR